MSTGPKARILEELEDHVVGQAQDLHTKPLVTPINDAPKSQRAVLVDLQGVNVSYHGRHVNISSLRSFYSYLCIS